jgi:hypothetical protein
MRGLEVERKEGQKLRRLEIEKIRDGKKGKNTAFSRS